MHSETARPQLMWSETLALGKTWTSLIGDFVASHCGGIRTVSQSCPACNSKPYDLAPTVCKDSAGREIELHRAFCGAEGRREDYQLLALMEASVPPATSH